MEGIRPSGVPSVKSGGCREAFLMQAIRPVFQCVSGVPAASGTGLNGNLFMPQHRCGNTSPAAKSSKHKRAICLFRRRLYESDSGGFPHQAKPDWLFFSVVAFMPPRSNVLFAHLLKNRLLVRTDAPLKNASKMCFTKMKKTTVRRRAPCRCEDPLRFRRKDVCRRSASPCAQTPR